MYESCAYVVVLYVAVDCIGVLACHVSGGGTKAYLRKHKQRGETKKGREKKKKGKEEKDSRLRRLTWA